MCIAGEVAIVTGASRGIGKAIAMALSKEGVKVVAAARTLSEKRNRQGSLETTVREIREKGGTAKAVVCDVSKRMDVENLVRSATKYFGKIDILVNNAAVLPNIKAPLVDLSVKDLERILNVNLRGPFLCLKSALPIMIENKKGSIINITSLLAVYAPKGRIAYGATKAGLDRLTFGLAEEVKEHNIAVNALTPAGLADTPGAREQFGSSDSWVRPEEVAKAAVWLAKQDAKSFTGKAIAVPASGRFTVLVYGKMSDEQMWVTVD